MTVRSGVARAALVAFALAAALACASNEPPGTAAGLSPASYYGGTIQSNAYPETLGRGANYRVGRPAYRY